MSDVFAVYTAEEMSEGGGSITNAVAHVLNILVQGSTFSMHCLFYSEDQDGNLNLMRKNTYAGLPYKDDELLGDQVDAVFLGKFPSASKQETEETET